MKKLLMFVLLITVALGSFGAAPPSVQPQSPPAVLPSWEIPYRMTPTGHVVIRVKINGHGPYNFVVDSGAPTVSVSAEVSKEAGVRASDNGWSIADRLEIEGGLSLKDVSVINMNMSQVEGSNALGLDGMKLAGSIGWTLLRQYRIEFDFTSDAMTWTLLPYVHGPLPEVGGGNDSSLDWIGTVAKLASVFVHRPIEAAVPRGHVGVELDDTDNGVTVSRVYPNSPAAAGGIQVGDRIDQVSGRKVKRIGEVMQLSAGVRAGGSLELTLVHDGQIKKVTIKTVEGL